MSSSPLQENYQCSEGYTLLLVQVLHQLLDQDIPVIEPTVTEVSGATDVGSLRLNASTPQLNYDLGYSFQSRRWDLASLDVASHQSFDGSLVENRKPPELHNSLTVSSVDLQTA